jgi:hypothetical protein
VTPNLIVFNHQDCSVENIFFHFYWRLMVEGGRLVGRASPRAV